MNNHEYQKHHAHVMATLVSVRSELFELLKNYGIGSDVVREIDSEIIRRTEMYLEHIYSKSNKE